MKQLLFLTKRILPFRRIIVNKKNRHYSIATFLVMLMAFSQSQAQYLTAASFPFTASSKTFTYLSGGTSVNTQADDKTATGIPIGFTFNYCGNAYTTVSACSNGWIAFGNKTSTAYSNSKSNASSIAPMLMPLWDDLQGSGSVSTYLTTGAPGERVFTFEWRNTRPLIATSNPEITIQVKLYEGDDAIEFMYKRESGTASFSSATIGIVGNSNSDFQSLSNSTANPVASTSTFTTNITAKPATGQSYLWGYITKGYNNATTIGIASPNTAFCPNVTLPVEVTIGNNGKNVINNVEVHWKLDNIVQPTINWNTALNTLGSSGSSTAVVPLGNVFFGTAPRTLEIYTSMPNGVADTVNGDDTLKVVLGAALNGTYTVGGTTPDFPDVVTAASTVSQFGVCGPVVFNVRPGTYSQGTATLTNILGSSTTNTVTFQAENGIATSVNISGPGTVLSMKGASHVRMKNLSFATSALAYNIVMEGAVSDDLFEGCIFSAPPSASSASAAFVATNLSGTNTDITFKNNTITGGYYGFVWDGNASNFTQDLLVENNTVSQYYYVGTYFYNTKGLKVKNNTLNGTNTSYYNMYAVYSQDSPEITGNRINNNYGYGLLMDFVSGVNTSNKGKIANNVITMIGGSSNYGGIYINYPNSVMMYNNSVLATGSYSTCYTFGLYMSSGYNNNEIYNNVSSNTGGGYAVYIDNSGTNNLIDYNTWYTSANSNGFYYNGNRADFAAYRTASNTDKHSWNYDPELKNDGSPDPNKAGCWAINGRGVHIDGNNKDINGNTRVTLRENGTPDIGAFEFLPDVLPPLATVTPSSADKGDTQVFMFGGNEIGSITWGQNAQVVPVEVRQYSGEKGSGIATAAAPYGSMYFHTDVASLGTGTTFDFALDIKYQDIWLGDIANESDLRTAHKVPGYQWMVYSGSLSTVNVPAKAISASRVNRFGAFTGLENGSIPSAFVIPQDKAVICIGTSVMLDAEPKDGDFYEWYRNGVAIVGASGANVTTYSASQQGDYSVKITYSGKVVESVPVTVTTIAPPNAVIAANGNLTYCTGNGLTLNAGNVSGITYQWMLNGVKIPGATSNTYPVSQAGVYRVQVENAACASVSTPTTVTAGPLRVNLGADTSYCEVKNVFAKLDAGYPGAKYLWSTGDTTQTIEVRKSGNYTVHVDAGPNCVDDDDITVTIDPLPTASGISFVQNGNEYQFFASGPVNVTGGIMWIFSDGTMSTVNSPVKTITGDLYVRLVLYNNCGTDTLQLGWPLTVDNTISANTDLSIYPNPATDKVTINAGEAKLQSVQVLNSVGAVVYSANINNTPAYNINVTGMASGQYILHAVTNSGTFTKKFDIVR